MRRDVSSVKTDFDRDQTARSRTSILAPQFDAEGVENCRERREGWLNG
jgi:hypothetical protein